MADCVVVLLDAESAAAVARLWAELEARWGVLPPRPNEPPHLTLAVLRGSYEPAAMRSALEEVTHAWAPFRVTSAGYGLFVGHGADRPAVLQLPFTRTPRLSALHEAVVCKVAELGLVVEGQYQPEHWRPHVTLADLGSPSQLVGEVTTWLVAEGPRHTTAVVDNLSLVTASGIDHCVLLTAEE